MRLEAAAHDWIERAVHRQGQPVPPESVERSRHSCPQRKPGSPQIFCPAGNKSDPADVDEGVAGQRPGPSWKEHDDKEVCQTC